jgi:DNA-directed RNA polymerase subunit E'/Rpb7
MSAEELTTEKACLTLTLLLPPEKLDKNYRDRLLESLRERYANGKWCTKDYGYIKDVCGIRDIDGRKIVDACGAVEFRVRVDAVILLPRVGRRADCRVEIVLPYGILVSHDVLKILVSAERLRLKGYSFQKGFMEDSYVRQDAVLDENKIQINDTVSVVLVDLRFEKSQFMCLGDLF